MKLPIDSIKANARQPRTSFDESSIDELAASIQSVGILQPLVVRPAEDGLYELIAGERRLRAARRAGLVEVPAVVRPASERASLEMALIENLQREDIGPMECARAYRRLIDEFGLNQEQVAAKVGKARTTVANSVRLLKLPTKVQEGLETGAITEGHARAILGLDHLDHQLAVFDLTVTRGLSVREIERMVSQRARAVGTRKASPYDASSAEIEDALATHLGAPVRIVRSADGGKLIAEFVSDEALMAILDRMGLPL